MGVADVEQGIRAPGELTQPDLCEHLVAACPFGFKVAALLLAARIPHAAAARPHKSTDPEFPCRGELR